MHGSVPSLTCFMSLVTAVQFICSVTDNSSLDIVITNKRMKFLPRDALVHSAVLRLHVVRPSVCLSVCDGGSGSHRLEILETNCTVN